MIIRHCKRVQLREAWQSTTRQNRVFWDKFAFKNAIKSRNGYSRNDGLAARLLNKAATLPANDFERYFNEFSEKNADFDFEKFAEIFENSASFEDAEKALLAAFEGENYPIAEQLLFELGANAELLGVFLQGDKK